MLALALWAAEPAAAAPLPACDPRPPVYTGDDPRVQRHVVPGFPAQSYLIALPSDYAHEPGKRYPVLYLLHGALSTPDEYLVCLRLLEMTAHEDLIVVMPDGGQAGFYLDWYDGTQHWETADIHHLIPHVDATYRTIAQRAGRAVAGLSMGGFGAMHYATRHPHLFVAAGSFSGLIGAAAADAVNGAVSYAGMLAVAPGATSDPFTPEGVQWRREHDPIHNAAKLEGMSVFLSSGNGVPCDADEAARLTEADPTQALEPLLRQNQQLMHDALVAAGVEHTYLAYDCGQHTFPTFQRGLDDFWPQLQAALGP